MPAGAGKRIALADQAQLLAVYDKLLSLQRFEGIDNLGVVVIEERAVA